MNFLNWLAANWSAVLMAAAVIAGTVWALVKGEKQILTQILVHLVTAAEAQLGSGTGALKKASVIAQVYPYIPAYLKPIITEKRLVAWMEAALDTAKKMWASNSAVKEIIGK